MNFTLKKYIDIIRYNDSMRYNERIKFIMYKKW